MLSRVAERLYWFARYVERVENTARLMLVRHQLILDLREIWIPARAAQVQQAGKIVDAAPVIGDGYAILGVGDLDLLGSGPPGVLQDLNDSSGERASEQPFGLREQLWMNGCAYGLHGRYLHFWDHKDYGLNWQWVGMRRRRGVSVAPGPCFSQASASKPRPRQTGQRQEFIVGVGT